MKRLCSFIVMMVMALCLVLVLPGVSTTPVEFRAGVAFSWDVPFVPTRDEIVAEMLRLVAPSGNDLLYDLGCGDGRIVITAAKNFGVKGIGIDIDPDRITESRKNAEKAGVAHKVNFINQNLYDAEFKEATIMTLYLLPQVNLNLRPRLFEQLRPGTKIVSHDFDMGDWKADRTVRIPGKSDVIYYWVVPANVGGTWQLRTSMETEKAALRLSQSFQQVKGELTRGGTTLSLSDVTLTGDKIAFTVKQRVSGRLAWVKYEGRVKGNTMEGAVDRGEAGPAGWSAERDASTVTLIDKKASAR